VRDWLRVACATVTLAVIAAPAAFGPAVGVVMRELGAAVEVHVCKCGMPVGKCGCPECDRLEHDRQTEHVSERVATFKRHCSDDTPVMPSAMLPTGVLASSSIVELPLFRGDRVPISSDAASWSSRSDEPSTPPPRHARV
jgi:hypothetical protein